MSYWSDALTDASGATDPPKPSRPAGHRVDKRKLVLVVDENPGRREGRAARLRASAVDVHCCSSLGHALVLCRNNSYDLVLLETRNDPTSAEQFRVSVRAVSPSQRIAFYVGSPRHISWLPPEQPDVAPDYGAAERASEVSQLFAAQIGGPVRRGSLLEAGWRIFMSRRLSVQNGYKAQLQIVKRAATSPVVSNGLKPAKLVRREAEVPKDATIVCA
jgi:hypothetical protein